MGRNFQAVQTVALKLVSALELRKGMGGSKNHEGVREAGNVTSVSLARGSWD